LRISEVCHDLRCGGVQHRVPPAAGEDDWVDVIGAARPDSDCRNGRSRAPGWRQQRWRGRHARAQPNLREVKVETWEAIRSRRNVRSYRQQAIAPQDLDRVLEAGWRAPSAGNQQAWDFILCTDPQQLTQLASVGPAARHVAGSAAAIALVAPRADDAQQRDLVQFDLGQATMSMMLAAADLGLGSAHAGVADQQLVRRLLGVPADRFCPLLLTLGVPADRPLAPIRRPNRRPLDEVVHRGRW
jgi:nitroreductase